MTGSSDTSLCVCKVIYVARDVVCATFCRFCCCVHSGGYVLCVSCVAVTAVFMSYSELAISDKLLLVCLR